MQLKVSEAILRANTTEEVFFKCAYVFLYGVLADLSADLEDWQKNGVPPYYVQVYANLILEQP